MTAEALKEIRNSRERKSELVVNIGRPLIKKGGLGEDSWNIYEQVCIAALDLGDDELAAECIAKLQKQFPRSVRVQRLVALQLEQKGKYDAARVTYKKLTSTEEDDPLAQRRLACVAKAERRYEEAIILLNKYLDDNMADVAGWQELAALHLEMGSLTGAAFCYEELILAEPLNYVNHLAYAEVQYSLQEYELALRYYEQSLTLNATANNVRAVYGVLLSLSAAKKTGANWTQLREWAMAKLLRHYQNLPDKEALVRKALQA